METLFSIDFSNITANCSELIHPFLGTVITQTTLSFEDRQKRGIHIFFRLFGATQEKKSSGPYLAQLLPNVFCFFCNFVLHVYLV